MLRSAGFALVLSATLLMTGAVAAESKPDAVSFGSAQCGSLAWRQMAFENNAVLLVPALTGVLLGADDPDHAKWKGGILFDSDLRDDLARNSKKGRDDAKDVSQILMAVSVGLPALDMLRRLKEPDCDETMNLLSDLTESFLLISLLEQGTKLLSARRRPGSDVGFKSFFSGHASFAGTASGLVCANAFKNGMWGDRWLTKAIPCALSAGLATATGVYRLKGDEHWPTDVIVGLLVGFASGYFDLPNAAAMLHRPLGIEWLKEHTGVEDASLTPTLGGGAVGLRFAVRY